MGWFTKKGDANKSDFGFAACGTCGGHTADCSKIDAEIKQAIINSGIPANDPRMPQRIAAAKAAAFKAGPK